MGKYTNMTIEDVISRIREECDKLYEKYEGNPLIEEDDILEGFDADNLIDWSSDIDTKPKYDKIYSKK